MDEFIYGTGCIPSVMDGTEHEISIDEKVSLPDSFDWSMSMPPVLDQGSTQKCVAYSMTGLLDFLYNSMNGTANICNNFGIDTLYNSRPNRPQEGMSIKYACSYMKHTGLKDMKINSYAKVGSVEVAKYALLMFGPVLVGMPVYNSGNYFWREGFGRFQGGHCVTLVGWDDSKNSFILRNSWGSNWGALHNGYTYLPYDEFVNCAYEAWTVTL